MNASNKIYKNKYLMNYIKSFIICTECNKEYEHSTVVENECKHCIIKAWEALGYYNYT